ncbi:MAG TPA: histidine kinase [Roseiflexaceae bacterium]|nr:histidine kinase [Roseiflexaceae bacterium]
MAYSRPDLPRRSAWRRGLSARFRFGGLTVLPTWLQALCTPILVKPAPFPPACAGASADTLAEPAQAAARCEPPIPVGTPELEPDQRGLLTHEEQVRFCTLSEDLCCIIGADGYLKRLNPAWKATTGFTLAELSVEPYLAFVHPEDRAATLIASSSSVVDNRRLAFENRCRCKDGTYRWLAWNLMPVPEDGYLYAIAHDITERKRSEQEQERLYRVAKGLHDILAVINSCRALDDILAFIIVQATRLLDVAAGQLYRLERSSDAQEPTLYVEASHGFAIDHVGTILKNAPLTISYQAIQRGAPIAIPDLAAVLDRLLAQPAFGRGQQQLVTEVRQRFRAMLAVPLIISGEVYGTISLYSEDPRRFQDEEVQLAVAFATQAALAIENTRLREQVQRAAVLEERRRLARELHDSVTQSLFSVSLLAQVLPDLWEVDQQEARAGLHQIRDLTRSSLAEMRALLLELRPAALGEHRLTPGLRAHVSAFERRTGIPVTIDVAGDPGLPEAVEQAFFRIAQEALANVARHAQARSIRVALRACMPVRLVIADDGQGFQPERIGEGCFGLVSMRERAAQVGAQLQVRSTAGQGTEVIVEWPGPDRVEYPEPKSMVRELRSCSAHDQRLYT